MDRLCRCLGLIGVLGAPGVAHAAGESSLTGTANVESPACPPALPAPWIGDSRAKGPRVVVVFKRAFHAGLYADGRLVNGESGPMCFPVAMGAHPQGPKTRQDNASTPEGWYRIAEKRDVGHTSFYRGFVVSYPNNDDADRALKAGVIDTSTREKIVAANRAGQLPPQGTAMGGWIMIHGMGSQPADWTWGCVGADNASIDAIFPRVKVGDPVLLIPWDEGG